MTPVFLDNAATSFPKPESVYRAVDVFMRENGGSPARGGYPKARESERILVTLRTRLARLLGVDNPSRIAFTCNATDALNLVLKGWLHPGDHVVVTDVEHNAVLRPLWRLRRSRQVEVTVVETNAQGEVDPDAVLRAVNARTRLVACVHASNVLGTLQPVGELATRLRARGIPLLVDGSQTAGAVPIDIDALGIDMFAFTGHKGLLGPTGTGGVVLREGLEIEPLRDGGNGINSEDLEQPGTWPDRFESGTPNMYGLAGLLAAVEFLQERGVETIRAHELELTRNLMGELRNVPGVVIHGPEAEKKVGITSITLSAFNANEVGQILAQEFGVMVRTGIHCSPLIHKNLGTQGRGTVRFSVGWATTPAEIETAGRAIRELTATVFRKRAS